MMHSDALRQRLEALNRGPLPPTVGVAAHCPAPAPARREAAPPATAPFRPGLAPALPGLVRQGHAVANALGEHWRVALPLEALWPGGESLVARRLEFLAARQADVSAVGDVDQVAAGPKAAQRSKRAAQEAAARHKLRTLGQAFPQRAVLLDLETCGLAGSALFLVGLLRTIDGRLAVELLLARNYAEESAVLASLWDRLRDESLVVTFNGKCFDWPMVVDRSRRHLVERGRPLARPEHIDLLHPARRRWRGQFADCRLQTLERHVCGRLRRDDIPGNQIPAAYAQYVRTGFEREMDAILLHNALDLVTLLDLALRLAG
jgi:uncharacterized protein YprB with RNaseH-like and TPR domain